MLKLIKSYQLQIVYGFIALILVGGTILAILMSNGNQSPATLIDSSETEPSTTSGILLVNISEEDTEPTVTTITTTAPTTATTSDTTTSDVTATTKAAIQVPDTNDDESSNEGDYQPPDNYNPPKQTQPKQTNPPQTQPPVTDPPVTEAPVTDPSPTEQSQNEVFTRTSMIGLYDYAQRWDFGFTFITSDLVVKHATSISFAKDENSKVLVLYQNDSQPNSIKISWMDNMNTCVEYGTGERLMSMEAAMKYIDDFYSNWCC